MLDVISVNYRVDAHNENSLDFKAAMLIFQKAKAKNYKKTEFWNAMDTMLEKQPFPNWTMADFFKTERPMVYGRNEVLKLSDGTFNGFQRVECEGINVPIWIKETDEILPPLKKYKNKNFVNFIPT